ncbi:hypothetical protein HPY207_07090 [Helicobacter pylori]|nr:hypothetical protein HPY207_07090 [Helicobacter pylori]
MLKNGVLFYCFRSYFVVKRIFFYFLKGIGVNFTLDPPKERAQKKKGFKRNPLKKGVPQRVLTL